MLISPPFLPARHENQSEDDWLDTAMICGQPGDGAFPISFQLGWHGGVHLTAPTNNEGAERVRAIADGTIVFIRGATTRVEDSNHPQNYRGWTDNGCIVIRHQTDIGSGENARGITFYSLYIHLSQINSTLQLGRRVYRKDELGVAGQIYGGTERKIHFEIVCDDDNLRKLGGRAGGELEITSDGRVDCIYGSLYFLLPEATEIFDMQPAPHLVTAYRQQLSSTGASAQSRMVPLQPTHVTVRQFIVELRYSGGGGLLANRGDLYVVTREMDGTELAPALRESEGEYLLFSLAKKIAKEFSAATAPAQTTVFEMLRFGRNVNVDNEAPVPVTLPHWRKISYSGGEGWVNLNLPQVKKFSEADFPGWCGWSFIDDSEDGDSRCDSAIIHGWLRADNNASPTASEANVAMNDPVVARRLAKAVCKFPTEWNADTIDRRWSWLKEKSTTNTEPLEVPDFEKLKEHIMSMCIDLPELYSAQWHWHPAEFLKQFRKCTWFSLEELTQMLPRRSGPNSAQSATIPWSTALSRIEPYLQHLNTTMRKFGIVSRTRQVHFLAQTYIETALWRTVVELGRARQQRRSNGSLYWPAPAMQYYQAFYGRGAMQLTWASNYDSYGIYRTLPEVGGTHQYADERITRTSMHYWSDPRNGQGNLVGQPRRWFPRFDPQIIATNAFYACDSAGYYWSSKNTGGGRININRTADQGVTHDAVGRASVLVNGGSYGFSERQGYAVYIERYLKDQVSTEESRTFIVNYRGRNHNVYVNFTPQRPR